MSAEDLDKLFRDKLKDRPVAPSNDAWAKLQSRMQAPAAEETPQLFMAPPAQEQKEERGPIRMWYYSAAAAVTMLLSVGLWVNRDNIDPLQPSGSVAAVEQQRTVTPSAQAPATEVAPAPSQTVEPSFNSATPAAPAEADQVEALASASTTERQQANLMNRKATNTTSTQTRTTEPTTVKMVSEPVRMAATTPVKKQEETKAASETAPLEIIVKLDEAQATTTLASASTTIETPPQEEETPTGSGRVLKGILKQVKNLKDGEKVNLAELGITKHTYALETRIGNKKITKTIEL
ncbi:hypothetical protein [Rufibacter psychrotolerans]|uniref:hypothetical protein n=1 Tax=Rufibacter psychrotolerans TaxID=2812556 RepID=UPI0019683D17|nr:hypothetical protein [Rufibacter sp. SYSU D00308]